MTDRARYNIYTTTIDWEIEYIQGEMFHGSN